MTKSENQDPSSSGQAIVASTTAATSQQRKPLKKAILNKMAKEDEMALVRPGKNIAALRQPISPAYYQELQELKTKGGLSVRVLEAGHEFEREVLKVKDVRCVNCSREGRYVVLCDRLRPDAGPSVKFHYREQFEVVLASAPAPLSPAASMESAPTHKQPDLDEVPEAATTAAGKRKATIEADVSLRVAQLQVMDLESAVVEQDVKLIVQQLDMLERFKASIIATEGEDSYHTQVSSLLSDMLKKKRGATETNNDQESASSDSDDDDDANA